MKAKLFFLVSLLLVGCNFSGSNSSVISGVSTCSNNSIINNSSSFSSFSSESSLQYNNNWPSDVQEDITSILGNNIIPFYNASSYESGSGVYEGTSYVFIDCYGSNLDTAVKDYDEILTSNGFSLSSSYEGLASKEISKTHVMYVQYTVVNNYFEILGYILQDKVDTWLSSDAIKSVIKYEIPIIEAETYQFYISSNIDGYQCLDIYAFGVIENYDLSYKLLLENNGYVVDSYSGLYRAVNIEICMELLFYMYDTNVMFLQAYCYEGEDWPQKEIYDLLGVDLPIYEEDGITYDVEVISSEGNEIFTIYCDNASSSSFENYTNKLEEQGWLLDEETLSNNSTCYFYNKDQDNEHYIQIIYNENYKCLVIAIIY